MSVLVRNVSVLVRNVSVLVRNVSVLVRNVSVLVRNVSVLVRNVSFRVRNMSKCEICPFDCGKSVLARNISLSECEKSVSEWNVSIWHPSSDVGWRRYNISQINEVSLKYTVHLKTVHLNDRLNITIDFPIAHVHYT